MSAGTIERSATVRPPAGADGPAGATQPQGERRVVGMRLIVTSTTVALIAAAVVTVGAVSERNARRILTHEIEARLLVEARHLALTSAGALLSDYPELTLVPLVKQMQADRRELAFVVVTDHNGVILGHAEARQMGERFEPPARLTPVATPLRLEDGERLLGAPGLLVVEVTVSHPSRAQLGHVWVALRRAYLDAAVASARRAQLLFLLGLLAAGIALASIVMSFLLRPIGALRAGLERIGRGDLDTPVRIAARTELGLLGDAVNDMAERLRVARREGLEKERLAQEVELARRIQQRLLPRGRHALGDHVVLGFHRPAAEVGGDYYDILTLEDGRAAIAIADVAGKGLGGCLVMSMVSALLRPLRHAHRSPSALLVDLERHLIDLLRPGEFVTMLYGVIDPVSGRFTYASAGHMPVLVYRASSRSVERHAAAGIPLGAMRGGVLRGTLEDCAIDLAPGDVLVQYTDGVSEAFDAAREQFGIERIEREVVRHAVCGADAVVQAVTGAVRRWTGDGSPDDDETLLVLERSAGAAVSRRDARADEEPGAAAAAPIADADPLELLDEAETRGIAHSIPARFDRLDGLGAWLSRCPDVRDLEVRSRQHVETALYEACANAIEHGQQDGAERTIDLWWVPARPDGPPEPDERLRHGWFAVRDRGFPFTPGRWQPKDMKDPNVWRRGRGLGLDIIHLTMSEVVYRPATAAGNLLFMTFDPARLRERIQETRHG